MSTATFLESDTTTQGTWHGVYGADGYNVINDTISYPAYATVTQASGSNTTWVASTQSAVGLLKPSTSYTDRIEAAWYYGTQTSSPPLTIDCTVTGTRRLALYFIDYQSTFPPDERVLQIQLLDKNTLAVLDTETLNDFSNGVWLIWLISGSLTINITEQSAGPFQGGGQPVVSGIFFDTPSTIFPPFVSRPRFEPAHYE